MKKTFETSPGTVQVRDVMIDTDGTNLEEGVEVRLDGKVLNEIWNIHVREINENNIEQIMGNLV